MIQFTLKCGDGHNFESWFQSGEAFEKLAKAGLVSCAVCGNSDVKKAIMAPRVRPGRSAVSAVGEADVPAPDAPVPVPAAAPNLQAPASEAEVAITELKKKIEESSDYVGKDFATEARAMYLGEAPERAIYGEAKVEDAKELIEEGVPVMPLPFAMGRKTN